MKDYMRDYNDGPRFSLFLARYHHHYESECKGHPQCKVTKGEGMVDTNRLSPTLTHIMVELGLSLNVLSFNLA